MDLEFNHFENHLPEKKIKNRFHGTGYIRISEITILSPKGISQHLYFEGGLTSSLVLTELRVTVSAFTVNTETKNYKYT